MSSLPETPSLREVPSLPDYAAIPSYGSRPAPAAAPTPQVDAAQRIKTIQAKIVDTMEGLVENLAAPPRAEDRLPVVVRRRQYANTLRTWRFCPATKCRKAHCCRGEPTHCLHSVLPLMPDALAARLKPRRRPSRL